MQTRDVEVRQTVRVTVDETKFTPEFMEAFRQMMFPLFTVEDHLEHLAQLHARGVSDENSFIEGYGPAKDFGIKFHITEGSEEVLPG